MGDKMTPVWCDLCGMWVPAEREPHRSPEHMDWHYAADHFAPAADDEAPASAEEREP
jgi:hypothetical protein